MLGAVVLHAWCCGIVCLVLWYCMLGAVVLYAWCCIILCLVVVVLRALCSGSH